MRLPEIIFCRNILKDFIDKLYANFTLMKENKILFQFFKKANLNVIKEINIFKKNKKKAKL